MSAASAAANVATFAVKRESIERAVASLLKWHRHHPPPPSDEFIYLILSFKTLSNNGVRRFYRLPLPHPLFSSICIFTHDRAQIRTETLNPSPLTLSLLDLRSLYSSRESITSLASSFDLFLVDRSIASRLPPLLGNAFYSKKKNERKIKEPVPVNLKDPTWSDKAREILRSTQLEINGSHCKGVRVGRISMEKNALVDNIVAAIEAAIQSLPKKRNKIKSIHLKSTESVALPIYKDDDGGDGDDDDKGLQKRKPPTMKIESRELKAIKRVKTA